MSRFVLKPALTILRILIVGGALASVVMPQAHDMQIGVSLVRFQDCPARIIAMGPHAVLRLALTAVTLSLL